MPLPRLVLITNPTHGDAAEDRFLAKFLSAFFEVEVVSPIHAPVALQTAERCLIRNAWPADESVDAFKEIERLIKERNILAYNPPHRRGYLEDKTYLLKLFQEGFPVIPTYDKPLLLQQKGETMQPEGVRAERFVVKPLDGCSSRGVRVASAKELEGASLADHIIQPFIKFIDEISFFFIDDQFVYALVSAGPNQRWNLVEYQPTRAEIAWAQRFVDWNKLPYGLQRIDACHLKTGALLLMEIEDQMPLLSLDVLSAETRERVCGRLAESLCLNLTPSQSKPSSI